MCARQPSPTGLPCWWNKCSASVNGLMAGAACILAELGTTKVLAGKLKHPHVCWRTEEGSLPQVGPRKAGSGWGRVNDGRMGAVMGWEVGGSAYEGRGIGSSYGHPILTPSQGNADMHQLTWLAIDSTSGAEQ